ncbi:MAG: hypothetical protein KAH20_10260 [Methylococcales bacterium]|nr:hypothetical protein [Methylococcales bacterium]
MNNRKIPVLKIFLEAVLLPIKHTKILFKVGLPLIITGSLLTIYGDSPPLNIDFSNDAIHSDWTWDEAFFLGLLVVLFLVSFVMAIVGYHRIFLMDWSEVEKMKLFGWTGNELKYVGWWVLIGLCAELITLPFLLLIPIMTPLIERFFENQDVFDNLIIYLPIYYVGSRWALVLPSSAIGIHEKTFSWSWQLSDGNGWRLTFLICLLPVTLELILGLLPTFDSIIYSLFVGFIWLIVGVIETGLLSLSYSYLELNSDDQNYEEVES